MIQIEKKEFKAKFICFLEEDVNGLSAENKMKYMKKWIREYGLEKQQTAIVDSQKVSMKVGIFVQTTFRKMIKDRLLSEDKIRLLQDPRYCKVTFDINYPFLKKVVWDTPLSEQKKINGYNRYWAVDQLINGERYLICSQWYERNKQKFIKWSEDC